MTVPANEVKSAPAEEPKPRVYLLTPAEAAKMLHTSPAVLAVWRCHRSQSLRFTRIGRKVFYTPEDIERFIREGGVEGDGPRPPVTKKRSERARKTVGARWAKRKARR
jgi:Helix-turn-helix domain